MLISALTFILIFTAVLGVVLALILYGRLKALDKFLKLKKYRKKEAGFADLLNYAALVDDGIVLGKDGSLMAAWVYTADDNASTLESQRNADSSRLNQAISALGSGWMLHIDAVSKHIVSYFKKEASHFKDEVSHNIDEERRWQFEKPDTFFESQFVLILTWLPPILIQRKFVEMLFETDESHEKKEGKKLSKTLNLLNEFKKHIKSIESKLSIVFDLKRLQTKSVFIDGREEKMDDYDGWGCLDNIRVEISESF